MSLTTAPFSEPGDTGFFVIGKRYTFKLLDRETVRGTLVDFREDTLGTPSMFLIEGSTFRKVIPWTAIMQVSETR